MALGFVSSLFDFNRTDKLSFDEETVKYMFLYDVLFGEDEQPRNTEEHHHDYKNTSL